MTTVEDKVAKNDDYLFVMFVISCLLISATFKTFRSLILAAQEISSI